MSIFFARSIERLLSLLIGALSIVLGYELFIKLADFSEKLSSGSGELKFGGVKVVLTHVGPGVFFALFGAAIIWISIRTQMHYSEKEKLDPNTDSVDKQLKPVETDFSKKAIILTYLSESENKIDDQAAQSVRANLLRDFRTVDDVASAISKAKIAEGISIPPEKRADFQIALKDIKEAAMFAVWNDDWGEYSKFTKWVRSGGSGPPPEDIELPAKFFLGQLH